MAAREAYQGLDRFEARKLILHNLEAQGLLVEVKDHAMTVPVSQRSGSVIEPRLSDQWFIKIQPLADKAVAAVRDGHIKFTPEMYEKTYFEWMGNIHDWCISAAALVGPPDSGVALRGVQGDHGGAGGAGGCATCGAAELVQETDVLDTWFSSGLLPFTVFGWPSKDGKPTADMSAFYPTDVLVTGFDILFFWVARMIMLGTHFMLDVPMADGGARDVEGCGAVSGGVHPCAGAGCGPAEDVEDEGQCDRSDLDYRAVRDGCGAVYAGEHGFSGHRYCVQRGAHGRVPGVCEQGLERGAVPVHEPGPGARVWRGTTFIRRWRSGLRGRRSGLAGGEVDFRALQRDCRRGGQGAGGVPVRRCGERGVPVLLGRALRLVPGAGEAAAELWRGRRARKRRSRADDVCGGVRSGAAAAFSVYAVHYRGDMACAVGEDRGRQRAGSAEIHRADALPAGGGCGLRMPRAWARWRACRS